MNFANFRYNLKSVYWQIAEQAELLSGNIEIGKI